MCHATRTESRYQLVAQEKLGTGSVVSLDAIEHDQEMVIFIKNEVVKENASCHLSPELEDLVVKQLMAGSQRMSVCNLQYKFEVGANRRSYTRVSIYG